VYNYSKKKIIIENIVQNVFTILITNTYSLKKILEMILFLLKFV